MNGMWNIAEQGNKYLILNLIPVFFFQREKMITIVSATIGKTSVLCGCNKVCARD